MANLEESPLFDEGLPPVEMEDEDLTFDLLEHVMPGDHVYFGFGNDARTLIQDTADITNQDVINILGKMDLLGELAEKPGKVDSKISKLKTRNYQIQGNRSSDIELNIVGISDKLLGYLESELFQCNDVCILVTDVVKEAADIDVDPGYRCLLLNGMRWVVDWSAEADGLWTVVITTTISGTTTDKIMPFTAISWAVEE